jgi:hypothetical protein
LPAPPVSHTPASPHAPGPARQSLPPRLPHLRSRPLGARRRPLAGPAWTARPLTFPAPRPFASSPSPFKRAVPLPGQTLARSLPLPSARQLPQSAAVGGPPPDCPCGPRPLLLLTRSQPSAASLHGRIRSPTRTSIRRRCSSPRPARPCRG